MLAVFSSFSREVEESDQQTFEEIRLGPESQKWKIQPNNVQFAVIVMIELAMFRLSIFGAVKLETAMVRRRDTTKG